MWKEYSIFGYKIMCKVLNFKSSFGVFESKVVALAIFKKGNNLIYHYSHGLLIENAKAVPNWLIHKIVDVIEWIS